MRPDELRPLEDALKRLSGTIDERIAELGKQKNEVGKQLEDILRAKGTQKTDTPAPATGAQNHPVHQACPRD